MLCRGECLPVKASECIRWKYEEKEECGSRDFEACFVSVTGTRDLEESERG